MADKMYYSEEEAAEKLSISVDELAGYVRDDKLRVFQDGARKMFKADEVDALLGGVTQPMDSGEIDLAPAGESDIPTAEPPDTADVVTIGDVGEDVVSGAEDTVITAEGISIFDEEDHQFGERDSRDKLECHDSVLLLHVFNSKLYSIPPDRAELTFKPPPNHLFDCEFQ